MTENDRYFKPHSLKQETAIRTDRSILLLGTGTQWGKTRVGALRMKLKIHQFTNEEDSFLITAPTYKTLQQSTLPAFLKVMDGCGVYDKKFDIFHVKGGGKVFCRTERDPDSIVGITNIRHIWGDEAGKYRKYFWENMQARADFCGCGIDLTTSPYSLNWIPKELIKPFERGLRTDVEYIQAASWENPYHSLHNEQKRNEKRKNMDTRRFDMIYGGLFGKMSGLVYDCFDEEMHIVKPFELPSGTRYYGGIDWGFTHPFALGVRAITPSGHHFRVSEFYKSGLTPSKMVEAAKLKQNTFNCIQWFADPARPDMIAEFNANGIPNVGANKDIQYGVGLHYDLIQGGKYQVFEGTSPFAIDEYQTYHYPEPEDIGPEEDAKEDQPVDQANHAMDQERYITVSTYRRSAAAHAPKLPEEKKNLKTNNHEKRIAALKRGNRGQRGSESFS